jgi:hypothetical protein
MTDSRKAESPPIVSVGSCPDVPIIDYLDKEDSGIAYAFEGGPSDVPWKRIRDF